jgi:Zn-dependent peptidase ImmA (M78 family)
MHRLLAPEKVDAIKLQANDILKAYRDIRNPLDRIVKIAADNDIQILQSELYEMSGALRKEKGKWVIYVNAADSAQRKLFTIAHELGHYFVHKDECDEFIDGQLISRTEQEKFAAKELEANEFAGNLIMPEEQVRALAIGEVTSESIQSLAKSFGVSTIAMATRLHNLGYDTPNR